MSSKLMNLAMMCAAMAGYTTNNTFGCMKPYKPKDDYGSVPTDKQKYQPKAQHEFTVKGVKIMAASKKDAIKKYNHLKK